MAFEEGEIQIPRKGYKRLIEKIFIAKSLNKLELICKRIIIMCTGGGGGQTYKSKVAEKSRLADQEMLGQIERGEKITRNAELDMLKMPTATTNTTTTNYPKGGVL